MKLFRDSLALVLLLSGTAVLPAADADADKLNTAVEALTRLENVNLAEKPNIKAAVDRVLEKTRGTPNFVRLVRHFHLTNQNPGLIQVAVNNPESEAGVDAVRLVLASGDKTAITTALATTNFADSVRLVQALGGTKEKHAMEIVQPLLTDEKQPIEIRRAAVRGLVQTREGADAIIAAGKADKLPDNLKFIAGSELRSARWPEVKSAAEQLFPTPASQNAQPLPPVSELVKMKGDSAKGAEVFRREATGCIKCHQVRGEGRDIGPALTEIGTKLAKEALYEAILDPSAGISFGFEAWTVQLKSGDEAYGLKVNQTADEIAIKDTNGIVTRYKRSDITAVTQSKTSIMPSGLQQTMTVQELVDLVDYLSTLKKTGQ